MDVVKIDDISRERARELYQEYKTHRHYATPVDDEIRKAYREIARGGVVIKALESVARAGQIAPGISPIDAETQDEIYDTWAKIIEKHIK